MLLFQIQGYWRRDRFLGELRRGVDIYQARRRPADVRRLHAECLSRHAGSTDRAEKLLVRAHEEAIAQLHRPIGPLLRRIEEEIYTLGKIG